MNRKPNPLLADFLDPTLPLPEIHWETVPPGVDPEEAWDRFDENIEGWVPIWFPAVDPCSGRSYGEFERASLFNERLEEILGSMHRWPLWGSARDKKRVVAIALLHLYCETRDQWTRACRGE
ncbi:MAG: hypothetical protein ACM3MN_07815 [Nitrospirota bacterium]